MQRIPEAEEMNEKVIRIYHSRAQPEGEENEDIPLEAYKRLKRSGSATVEEFKQRLRTGVKEAVAVKTGQSRIQSSLDPVTQKVIKSEAAKHNRSRSDGIMEYHKVGDLVSDLQLNAVPRHSDTLFIEETVPVEPLITSNTHVSEIKDLEDLQSRVNEIRNVATSSGLIEGNRLLDLLRQDIENIREDESLKSTGFLMVDLLHDLY